MKAFIALTCVLFVARSLLADPYSVAIQQAKRVANQETEANRRLMNNPAPATPPQNNPNQPTNPELKATLENIQNLQKDLSSLGGLAGTSAITTEKQGLTNDLATAALNTKPSPESLSKLADDLANVIVGNAKLRPQYPKLGQYLHAIFNSAQLTEAQRQMIFTEVQKILTGGGVSPDNATTVVNDLKTISNE
ncbi:MAG TPA: hypothetical protein VFY06_02110, partial [Verrucomicrobiae bacterium]|nr:hypothetical protein [Verrucomicrobiae bacterium]